MTKIKALYSLPDVILKKSDDPINSISWEDSQNLPPQLKNLVFSGEKLINLSPPDTNFIFTHLYKLLNIYLSDVKPQNIDLLEMYNIIRSEQIKEQSDINLKHIYDFFKYEIVIPLNKQPKSLDFVFKLYLKYVTN